MTKLHDNPRFWATLEQFVASSQLVVDRPKGSLHPRFPEIVYPLDYGFLEGTTGGDGDGVDVWLGTQNNFQITGVACTADPYKRDAELKILLGCSSADFAALEHFSCDRRTSRHHCATGKAMTASEMQTHLKLWGDYNVLEQLEGGFRNTAFLVEAHNTKCVAKTTRRDEAAMRWLQPVHAAAQQAGFLTPDLIENTNGTLVSNGVTLETFIEGRAPSRQELNDLVSQIQTFHNLTRAIPQRPGFSSSIELLQKNTGGDVDLNAMPDNLVALCRQHWREQADQAQSVIHGDLNANNVLIGRNRKYGLIDWDETRVDISDFDVQALLKNPSRTAWLEAWEVAVCWQVEPEYARRLSSSPYWKGQS